MAIQETSLEAFESIRSDIGKMQELMLTTIYANPGMSNHDISRYLCLEINKVTPRVKEIRDMGLVYCSGTKRDRLTGRRVLCWRIKGDYFFKNKDCPVCGKPVNSYSYHIVNGKKVHLECDR